MGCPLRVKVLGVLLVLLPSPVNAKLSELIQDGVAVMCVCIAATEMVGL